MTSEKRRLIGEVAPCPPPTTSSTLLLLFPLVPTPPPHTALSSPRKVRKLDQRSVRPSVRSRLWKVNEWLIWFARAGEGTEVKTFTCTGLQRGSSMLLFCGSELVSSAVRNAKLVAPAKWSRRVEGCCFSCLRAATACDFVQPACPPACLSCELASCRVVADPARSTPRGPPVSLLGTRRFQSAMFGGGPSYMTDRPTAEPQQQNTQSHAALLSLFWCTHHSSPLPVRRSAAHVTSDGFSTSYSPLDNIHPPANSLIDRSRIIINQTTAGQTLLPPSCSTICVPGLASRGERGRNGWHVSTSRQAGYGPLSPHTRPTLVYSACADQYGLAVCYQTETYMLIEHRSWGK